MAAYSPGSSLRRKLRAKRLTAIAAWIAITIGFTTTVTIQVAKMEVHMDAHVELIVQGKAGADVIPGGVANPRKR
ncbi:MAG TPA: hypothetical protein VN047_00805 [Sphingopyxis sp.]|uniref:hypothetical protein n=1 Tax=Sphingopyxis sp. TaxID=1908224 RepID=UPI002B76640D|nr:hypothetical protein [Sphingopyxis sp.]HWW55409.1 hypothetical protein [Sphingopyxis sp.]